MKEIKKPRVGLYTMGLKHYWNQFPSLKSRLEGYGEFIISKIGNMEADIYYYGIVDDALKAQSAGEYFNENNVDIIFAHAGTYVTSSDILPIHQICKSPTVILNLQPTAQINYEETTTEEWLAHCGACPVPEIVNAFNRVGIKNHVVNGLLGLDYTPTMSMTNEDTSKRKESINAWSKIEQWVNAARVKRNLQGAKFGFLGNYYSGMLDMYSDFTMFQGQTGTQIQILEMCDLNKQLDLVTEEETNLKIDEIKEFFEIADSSGADPLNKAPTIEELKWSAKMAVAQEKMVEEFNLDALCYYYHSYEGNPYEQLQTGFIVGHSLLTAQGIPCAGEGDLKTCLAMKICDILNVGGSFCEIVCTDYIRGTMLLGHDGPFHLSIAKKKPILRSVGQYHGKVGGGISVEAKVKTGDITTLGCTQTHLQKLKFIASEGKSMDAPIMTIGNTQTHVKFSKQPDEYMDTWFNEVPTHHFAMSIGCNNEIFKKVADLLEIDFVKITDIEEQ